MLEAAATSRAVMCYFKW